MSNDFLDACVQVIRCGFGMPAFNNDEIVIPELLNSVLNRRTLTTTQRLVVSKPPSVANGAIAVPA